MAQSDQELYPFDYNAMRRSKHVLRKVEDGLLAEQGQICAYAGRRITRQGKPGQAGFHIEHLKPQARCGLGEDCDYENMVACWPEPNQTHGKEYGAVKKDNWPAAGEDHLFVSPLHADCSGRFCFVEQEDPQVPGEESKWSNWMKPATAGDGAAEATIHHLNLNHRELRTLRSAAVSEALIGPDGTAWSLSELRNISTGYAQAESDLDAGNEIQLDAFCFAIRQALSFHTQQREASSAQT